MWLIFIMVCVAVALVAMAVLWICNIFYLFMQRRTRKFQKELEKEKGALKDDEEI